MPAHENHVRRLAARKVFGKADSCVRSGVLGGSRPKQKTARRRFDQVGLVEEKYLKSKGHWEIWFECLPDA